MHWIKKEYHKLDRSPRALRRFGLTIGAALLLLGGILAWRHRGAGWPMSSVGAVFVLFATVAPKTLAFIHGPWMIFSFVLGWLVTRVLLTLVFFFVVTPIGLLQRLFGQSALEVAFRAGATSYWRPRTARPTAEDYEKQY
jgi:hypothetical protein